MAARAFGAPLSSRYSDQREFLATFQSGQSSSDSITNINSRDVKYAKYINRQQANHTRQVHDREHLHAALNEM